MEAKPERKVKYISWLIKLKSDHLMSMTWSEPDRRLDRIEQEAYSYIRLPQFDIYEDEK